MTWIQFFMWSVISYAFYYGFNILIDSRKGVRANTDNGADEVLHFTESQPPTIVKEKKEDPPIPKSPEPPTVAEQKEKTASTASKPVGNTSKTVDKAIEANGVGLITLFSLARKESINITNKTDFTSL